MAASVGHYDAGDLVRLRATLVSTDLVTPADASTVDFLLLFPNGSVSTYRFGVASVTRAAAGAYYCDFTPTVYGEHAYRVVATGGVQAADEWSLIVKHSKFL